jgi:hypothetical protein
MQVLSDLVTSLNGHSSMCGSNTVSIDPDGSLPSTSSESTDGVTRGDPALDVPDTYSPLNRVHGDEPTAGAPWSYVQGVTDHG